MYWYKACEYNNLYIIYNNLYIIYIFINILAVNAHLATLATLLGIGMRLDGSVIS